MNRKTIYNNKGYWKRRFKQLDLDTLQLLNFERSGAIDVPISDYSILGNACVDLGLTGETILDNMVKHGFSEISVVEMRNMINMIEVFSIRLKTIAETKWGRALEHFPVFKCSTATIGDLVEKSRAIQEMNKLLEGE